VNDPTMPANPAARSANPAESADSYSLGMDRVIGNQAAPLPTGAGLNPSVGGPNKKSSWFSPVGKLFKVAAYALASCVEIQRSLFSQLAPRAVPHRDNAAGNASRRPQPSPDELAYSMDMAMGNRLAASSGSAASRSLIQAQPIAKVQESSAAVAVAALTPDELAFSMDVAIGARFTADVQAPPPMPEPEPVNELAMAAKAGY
jgi:cell division septation protein DedD